MCLRIMKIKWWRWPTIAVSGSIVWLGIVLIADGLDWVSRSSQIFFVGGVIVICAVCVALPLVFKAIKSGEGTPDTID